MGGVTLGGVIFKLYIYTYGTNIVALFYVIEKITYMINTYIFYINYLKWFINYLSILKFWCQFVKIYMRNNLLEIWYSCSNLLTFAIVETKSKKINK